MITKKCESCGKEMILRIVNKKGEKNFGQVIIQDKNKRFCSRECQKEWQKNVNWDVRVVKMLRIKLEKKQVKELKVAKIQHVIRKQL
jgi:hypothetical protein